jgi:hypothetical protein
MVRCCRFLVPLTMMNDFDSAISSLEGLMMQPEAIDQGLLSGGAAAVPDEMVPRNNAFIFQPP